MINSLWGNDFNLTDNTDVILKKAVKKQKPISLDKQLASDSLSLEERLSLITENVYKILGKQKNNVVVIKSKEQLHNYIDKAIKCGYLALDTETSNTLDYLNCKLVGPCLYVPGQKQAYIPINHVNPKTNERLAWQLTEQEFTDELKRAINACVKIIFHNYKFDYQVIKMTCGIDVPAYWDTMIGIKMINELEKAGLKVLYIKHFDRKQQKYSIEHLFNAKYVKYAQVDPDVFALYAATDSMMTLKEFKYQESVFNFNSLKGMYKVFREIEMPTIKVVANMEMRGIGVDQEYAQRLSKKYHKIQDAILAKVEEAYKQYIPQIEAWKETKEANEKPKVYATPKQLKLKNGKKNFPYEDKNGRYKLGKSKAEQLETPLNLDSPTQLAILLFDILKFPEGLGKTVDDTPRGTGSNVLEILANDYNFTLGSYLAEKKGIDKLVGTFIDVLPNMINPYDNKIHCSFNQLGAIARFSSDSPNLQQIPAKDIKDIRPMFCVDEGKVLVGADLSAAEVRAAVNNSGDKAMIACYNDPVKNDIYALIGSMAYKCDYFDACEFYPEGTKIMYEGHEVICGHKTHTNKAGKERRSNAKKIVIGAIYGRGPGSIAEQIGCSLEEAKQLLDNFFNGFPRLAQWMEEEREHTKQTGFVDDILGRRRHLPSAQLPRYELRSTHYRNNPFLNCSSTNKVDKDIEQKYISQLENTSSYAEAKKIKDKIAADGYILIDNQSKIAKALRESPNWCAQAQTASWIKLNMIAIDNDPILKELGAELLLTIHDEVQMQCPKENAVKVKERLEYLMSNTCKDIVCVPLPSDGNIEWSGHWYMSEVETLINAHFNAYMDKGMTKEQAYQKICEEETELLPENIYNFLFKGEYLKA